jgi:phospholipase C
VDAKGRRVWVDFDNDSGKAGAALAVRNNLLPEEAPRRYSISAGMALADYWLISSNDSEERHKGHHAIDPHRAADYDLEMHGPNGYFCHLRGIAARSDEAAPEVSVRYDHAAGDVVLTYANAGAAACTVKTVLHYGEPEVVRMVKLAAGGKSEDRWRLEGSNGWFDLSVSCVEAPLYLRRFAGHVETGKPSMSDPGSYIEA